ncbi:MAG: peptide chain release factor N(5)-glutamine methyltransferase [Elusimicrobiota bacterium]
MTNAPEKSPRLALQRAKRYLAARRIGEPGATAEFLLAGLLGVKRTEIFFLSEIPKVVNRQFWRLLELMARRRLPLAYALGRQDFLGLSFIVKPKSTLIPRPETELLVEFAADKIRQRWATGSALKICDMGTGSGCIALSLWRRLSPRYRIKIWGVDCSKQALKTAALNAGRLGVPVRDVQWGCGRFFSALPSDLRFDAIVSNPPYVRTKDWVRLDPQIRLWEPRTALDGGPDGLGIIRPLITLSAGRLTPGGLLALEFGAGQEKKIPSDLHREGFGQVAVLKDLAGRPRIVLATFCRL